MTRQIDQYNSVKNIARDLNNIYIYRDISYLKN